MSCVSIAPAPAVTRRATWAAILLLLILPPAFAEVPDTVTRKGNVDDARGYQPIHHPLRARGGVVVSQSKPASEVGVRILRDGGNAIDAAIAVGLAEAVTLPRAGNLGGGGAIVIYVAKDKRTTAFDYYGAAPAATTPKLLLGRDGKPDRGASISWKGVAVPGTLAAFYEAHQKYGRLPWAQLVQPAIELAEQGTQLATARFPMSSPSRRTHWTSWRHWDIR